MSLKAYSLSEISQHKSENDCWVALRGMVYDLTKFLEIHPGGRKIILKHAGTDATEVWDKFHVPNLLDKMGKKYCIGTLGEQGNNASGSANEEFKQYSSDDAPFGELIPYADPSWYQGFSSPYYKESHRRVRAFIREFTEKHISPYCHQWDEERQLPRELYIKCGKAGILNAIGSGAKMDSKYFDNPLPANVPPEEWDAFHNYIVMDEICRCASGGVTWGIVGGLGIGLPPIVSFASDYIKDKVVRKCLNGTANICLCITEPWGGSDVANLRTEARKTPDGKHYIVNGEKKWITNGTFADFFTVAVRTGGPGAGGISFLLLERSMPGVKTRKLDCSGVLSSGTSYITFEDVKVPVENLIGRENKGFKYIVYNFNHERLGIVMQCVRFSRVCFEESVKWANKRMTFGKKLIQHDVIRNKLAHMARQIEATHSWLEVILSQTMHMTTEEQMIRLGGPAALLKAQATVCFELCAREAAQIFGGLAYTKGGQGEKVERLYREVRAYAIPGGSEEIMLDLGIRQSVKVAQMFGAKL